MFDSLLCGNCSKCFRLEAINKFIEHKVTGCLKPQLTTLPTILECIHCDECFLSSNELIIHAENIHRLRIFKTCKQLHLTSPDIADFHEPVTNETYTSSDSCNTRVSCSEQSSNSASSLQFPDQKVEFQTPPQEMITPPYHAPDPGEIELNDNVSRFTHKFVRKTCCLVDGGPPCSQITSCPILSTENTFDNEIHKYSETEKRCDIEVFGAVCNPISESRESSVKLPFTCGLCGQSFKQKIHLSKHFMSIHSSDKPFKCNECDYQTVEKSHLTTHSRRHTGERPFACMLCNYKAAQHSTLKQHCIKKHQKMYVRCQHCGTQFVTLTELMKHKRSCISC